MGQYENDFLSSRARKQNVWHFQTQDHYKYLKVKQVGVTLWNRETDQNQTENEGRKLSSLQTANGEQDSVIDVVCYLDVTQGVSCYCRNSIDFFFFWQLKIHNKLLSCWKPSHWHHVHGSLIKPQFLCMTVLYSTFQKQKTKMSHNVGHIKHWHALFDILVLGVCWFVSEHWCWNNLCSPMYQYLCSPMYQYLEKFGRMIVFLSVKKKKEKKTV